jgi:hypothetical protein
VRNERGIEETSASYEARSAPRSYPTAYSSVRPERARSPLPGQPLVGRLGIGALRHKCSRDRRGCIRCSAVALSTGRRPHDFEHYSLYAKNCGTPLLRLSTSPASAGAVKAIWERRECGLFLAR